MASYKDILNQFGGDTSYADRFQAAALKGDTAGMSNVVKEYKGLSSSTPTTPTKNTTGTTTTTTPTTPITTTQTSQTDNGVNVGNWNYGADTPDRQDEIVSNLNQAYQQDPSKFQDWATFAQNFNYDYSGRSDKERETMRNWYSQLEGGNLGQTMDYNDLNNTGYFFNQLMNGGAISGTGAAIDNAKTRYSNWQYLSGMQPSQIASAIASGALNSVGQEMQDLKQYSPALYAQVQAAMQGKTQVDDINAVGESIYNGLTGLETNKNYTNYDMSTDLQKNASIIKQYNESLYNKILGLGGDTAAYVAIVASMLQNPAIQNSKNEVEELEGEINKIQEQIYTIGDSTRVALGSEAPEDLVSAYISQQTKLLQNQLRTAQNTLLVAQGKLNNQLSEVDTLVDALNYGMKTYGEGGTGSSDYQFISGTKYQKAGYFNKKTGEFIPLGGGGSTGTSSGTSGGTSTASKDTSNYSDDSEARLNEIRNKLSSYLKTNPEYFANRTAYNQFFKYNQRSDKQKKVLDEFYLKYGNNLGANKFDTGESDIGTETSDSNLVNAIKKSLVSGPVNFSSTSMRKEYGKYGTQAQSWDEDTTNDYLQEIGRISTLSELKSMLSHLSKEANKKALLTSLKTKVVNELSKMSDKTAASKKFIDYANKLGLNAKTLADRWGIKYKEENK